MSHPTETARLYAILLCLVFFLSGLVFIPYVGLQNDEVLFSAPLYPPQGIEYAVRIGGHTVPVMLMSYLGTAKTWFYKLFVFSIWPPSPWSVRIPVLLAGVLTIWLFFELVLKLAGRRTALAATALIATDAVWVLTTCLDWGPVALQHLFLISGVLAIYLFHRSGRRLYLAAGFFLFGLGLWDKALFVWPLAGLAIATAVAVPKVLFSRLTVRNVAVAAAALLLGAAPLLIYNRATGFRTFTGNTQLSSARFSHKAEVLRRSLEGSVLFGYIVRNAPALEPGKPAGALERGSVRLSEAAGHRRRGLLGWMCLLSFALLPWLWNTPARKTMLFAAVFVAVTWLQMAISARGGGGAHHTVLLWPFPHLFVAVALAQLSQLRRAGLAGLVLVITAVCGSNLLVLNEHLARLIDRGTTTAWTDAIYPLSSRLRGAAATRVYVTDWGIYNVLRALNEGGLPLDTAGEELEAKDAIFVGHTEGNVIMPATAARLEAVADSQGLRKQIIETIADRNRRPIFELYRFTRP